MARRLLTAVFAVLLICMAGCGGPDIADEDWLEKDFSAARAAAEGSTVRFYMWGGSAQINEWVDTYLAGEVREKYGITLVRVPMDASVFVNKLLTEKAAGREKGTIDLLWINGENFKACREAEALFGPYAEKLPNYNQYVDKELAAYDFGFPVEGYETPYGKAQFVFEFDPERDNGRPGSFAELEQWVKEHPGKFTYPQPPDFTGSAFIRQAFYAVTGGVDQYLKGWDQELFERNAPKLWEYLNRLEPYLWQGGQSYPKDVAALDTLFARGEVDINMSYHPMHAQNKIMEGLYPESVRTFVMKEGAIFNLHFNAIPFNASNKAGAMVVANFLMSPEAQLSKLRPENWGDFPGIDVSRLSQEQREAFEKVDLGEATLGAEVLSNAAVPEVAAEYVEALEKGWEENVLR